MKEKERNNTFIRYAKLSLNEFKKIHLSITQLNIIGSNFLGDGRAGPDRLVGVPDS